jgi:cysteate synthase
VNDVLEGPYGGSITYLSESLADEIGIEQLYISFNGYWPERNADLITCSFKDLEAPPTIEMLRELGGNEVLVVSSAGNTARAFTHVSAMVGYPLALVVPCSSMKRLWLPDQGLDTSSIFVVEVEGDYCDAIALGERLSLMPGFAPEGGARNVARRDGMGTVMLEGALQIGQLPRHYFQAVGSGTGGISAWEASLRLIGDGRFGDVLPRLHLVQNLPCAPIYSAANHTSYDERCPNGMVDDVLFNRKPPYSIPGGVADAVRATNGDIIGMTTKEAYDAKNLFERVEGIDIMPAAATAVAALMKAISEETVPKGESILLNVTGGGTERIAKEMELTQLRSDLRVGKESDIIEIAKAAKEALKEVGRR